MYSSIVTTTLTILTSFVILLLILMPYLLRGLGLHPSYVGNVFNLENKSALIISTSHGLLNYPGQTTGKKSGLASHELTAPYYEFVDANMKVDIASIKGGEIPVDPLTISYFVKSSSDKRFYKDESALIKLNNALKIDDVNFTSSD